MNTNTIVLSVIIPSAGEATRMNGVNKLLYQLGDLPVVAHSIRAFQSLEAVKEIIVVCRAEEKALYQALVERYKRAPKNSITYKVVVGGDTRQASVFSGIEAASPQATHYAVHDGARPMISPLEIKDCLQLASKTNAAALGVPVKDTVKIIDNNDVIVCTPPRSHTYTIQTPQIFEKELYLKAKRQALADGKTYTDDCQLVEQLGEPVYVSRGSYSNIKITTPEDLPLAEQMYRLKGKESL